MEPITVKKIAITGAGQMGSGIAQVAAMNGYLVKLHDISQAQLEKAFGQMKVSLSKLHDKGIISADARENALGSIKLTTKLEDLNDSDFAIEAITENEAVKLDVFKALDNLLPKKAIIASNTSSIPITRLASSTQRPGQVIGMHFMNPVPLMKLVEIIPGFATDPAVTAATIALAEKLGKQVSQSQDYPGFVVNRILMPMINEAFNVLHENIASAEDIDKGMKLGTNQPMGPLTLADFIGLDTCLAIMRVLYQGTFDPRFRPSPLLTKYVEAGFLGKKTGRGVYTY